HRRARSRPRSPAGAQTCWSHVESRRRRYAPFETSPLPNTAKTADHIIRMNKVLPLLALVLVASVAACAPVFQWQKAGADDALMQKDSAQCRQTAQAASNRNFSQPMPLPWAGSESWTPYTGLRQDNPNMWFQSPYAGESPAAYDSR